MGGQGQVLLADRAYDSDDLGKYLLERGAMGNIRLMSQQVRFSKFCPDLYK